MEPIIEVKNLGKKYKIAHERGQYVALRDVLTSIVKKPVTFIKTKAKQASQFKKKEDFWALRDINFTVEQGEAVGIIGRNGAGKSTLLKILTGITPPSEGEAIMRGKVSSLLEVGTGFHPELTGRENIFLNGAILGMSKSDIAKKFDQIVEFAGIGKFLDTPVKRYSSGMYVRLAFSVAAHMEPDILLVDEVLAVGDAEFQKKCLGKMEEVTRTQGRTILFISHNMAAIQNLCKKCILIEKGKVKMIGKTEEVVNEYMKGANIGATEMTWEKTQRPGDDTARLISMRLIGRDRKTLPYAYSNQEIGIEMRYEVLKGDDMLIPNMHFFTNKGECAFISHADYESGLTPIGQHIATAWIPSNLLNEGSYIVGGALSTMMPLKVHFFEREALMFQVLTDIEHAKKNDYNERIPGVLKPRLVWENDINPQNN
jgi:lipopolysaccharide transport system ATP-binding protein